MLPFQDMGASERRAIEECLPILTIDPPEVLLQAGRVEGACALILSGSVAWLLPDGSEIGRGGMGELAGFGQLVWPDRPMPHTVKVMRRSQVMVIDSASLDQLQAQGIGARNELERYALLQMIDSYKGIDHMIQQLIAEQEDDWEAPSPSLFDQLVDLFGISPDAGEIDAVAALRCSPLFADASDFALSSLAERMKPCAFDAGDVIGNQFEGTNAMHLVVSGRIALGAAPTPSEEPHPQGSLGPGGLSGFACTLGSVRLCTAVAAEDTVTLALDAESVRSMAMGSTEAGGALRTALLRATWDAVTAADIEVRRRSLIRETIEDHRAGKLSDARTLALLGTYGYDPHP